MILINNDIQREKERKLRKEKYRCTPKNANKKLMNLIRFFIVVS